MRSASRAGSIPRVAEDSFEASVRWRESRLLAIDPKNLVLRGALLFALAGWTAAGIGEWVAGLLMAIAPAMLLALGVAQVRRSGWKRPDSPPFPTVQLAVLGVLLASIVVAFVASSQIDSSESPTTTTIPITGG